MKVPNVQLHNRVNPNFNGKIIDAHTHVGTFTDGLFGTCDKFEIRHFQDILSQPISGGADTVEKIIVSNLDCINNKIPALEEKARQKGIQLKYLNEIDGNRDMLKISQQFPILKPLAVCQPNETANAKQIRSVIREGTFYGLKFHPLHMKLAADDYKYDDYMRVAQENHFPCLFHTDGVRCPYSSPEQVYELAKRHPKVPVILAHMGAGEESHSRAVKVLLDSIEKGDALIYADISWVDDGKPEKKVILDTLEKLQHTSKGDMTNRLLFGTDAPLGKFGADGMKDPQYYRKNIEQIKTAIRGRFNNAEALINKLFYENAQELFFTKNWAKSAASGGIKGAIKKFAASKTGAIIIGGVLALGTGLNAAIQAFKTKPESITQNSLKIIA